MRPLRVYVSGPYRGKSADEVSANRKVANDIGKEIALRGHIPFVPHTMIDFWQDNDPRFTFERVAKLGMSWLDACDALFYIGPSVGADAELAYAKERNKLIFTNIKGVPFHKNQ